MSKLDGAMREINRLEEQAAASSGLNRYSPLGKLLLTMGYVAVTVSFGRCDLSGLCGMVVYPVALFILYEIPFGQCLKRIRLILPLLVIMGILNPVFDRTPLYRINGFLITGGMVSMATLMIKGLLSVLAVYLLIISTSIWKICAALRSLHVPQMLVTVILLIYRYLSVLLEEAGRITQAYSLRAPGQKGIHFKVWGSLLGQLLLRSMDRAADIYDSMCVRGFENNGGRDAFAFASQTSLRPKDWLWTLGWGAGFVFLRFVPLFKLVGGMI